MADVHRDASSGHIPESSLVFEYRMKNVPKPKPAAIARSSGARLFDSGAWSSVGLCDEINATEPTAERDAEKGQRRRSFTEGQAPRDRDDGGYDRSDRRDRTHTSEREPLVEERDRHHAHQAGGHPDDDVLLLRIRPGVQRDDRNHQHGGEGVREEDHPEHGDAP